MNRPLTVLSAVVFLVMAGCAATSEEDASTSSDAFNEIIDDPAVTPDGPKPKVTDIDLRGRDLTEYGIEPSDTLDLTVHPVDILSTDTTNPAVGQRWVRSDATQSTLPVASSGIHGPRLEVGGGGTCRITKLSVNGKLQLKSIAVGCKWTW